MFIPDDLMEMLEQHCFINRVGKRDTVVQALSDLLMPKAPSTASSPTSPSSPRAIYQSDEDDGFDDVDIIIVKEYEWLTGKRFGPADREHLTTLRQFPVETILIGMLETTYNKRKRDGAHRAPINSLGFFVRQVLAIHEEGIASKMTPSQYIAYLRGGLKKNRLVPEMWK